MFCLLKRERERFSRVLPECLNLSKTSARANSELMRFSVATTSALFVGRLHRVCVWWGSVMQLGLTQL